MTSLMLRLTVEEMGMIILTRQCDVAYVVALSPCFLVKA